MPSMLSELVIAIFELGLPVAALSWLLFYRLYSRGELARDLDRKAIGENLKTIRKAQKESEEPSDSLVHAKWMKFGGGFYGVAAAWTLIYIEASGVVAVVLHPSILLTMFHKGIVDFIVQKITGQVTNLVDAAIWFTWWPAKGHGPVVWFAVAYFAYLAGLNLARYETGFGHRFVELDSRGWWRSLVPFPKRRTEAIEEEGGNQLGPSEKGGSN